MAAAMLSMVCNFTIGRPRYAEVEPQIKTMLDETLALRRRLVELANADVEAYGGVRAAYALPRASDEEREARRGAIEASMHEATMVPAATAEAARQVLDLALHEGHIANVQLLSDVAVAAHLALASLHGAADQARLNLAGLSDAAFAGTIRERLERATGSADTVLAEALQAVESRSTNP